MKQFYYVAQTIDGQVNQGEIACKSKQELLKQLRNEGLFVVNIQQMQSLAPLSEQAKLNFMKRLHLLLQSALPLYDCLQLIYEQAAKHKEKRVFQVLLQNVHAGKHFSDVLQEYHILQSIYIALIRAGERGGNLVHAIQIVCDLMEHRQKLKRSILSALSYPLFIAIFAIVCFYSLLLFVVPNFEGFFEGIELPSFTRFIFALSKTLKANNLVVLCSFAASCLILYLAKPKRWIWGLPILSSLGLQRDLFLFSKAFHHLYDADVDILSILDLSKDLVMNPKLKQRITGMGEEMKNGFALSESFAKSSLNIGFFVQMIKVGEQSANLSEAFSQISSYFEAILQHRIKRLLNFLQPIVLLIVASFIGIIMLSILMPMTDVSRFVDF